MKKYLLFFMGLFFLISCKEKDDSKNLKGDDVQEVKKNEISAEDIESFNILEFGLSAEGKSAVENWSPYQALVIEIDNLKSGDISYFLQDSEIFRTQLEELGKSIPENIKTKPIQARLLAFNTKLFVMNNLLRLQNLPKTEKLQSIKEFLVAYSNLLLQINKKLELDSNINVLKSEPDTQ